MKYRSGKTSKKRKRKQKRSAISAIIAIVAAALIIAVLAFFFIFVDREVTLEVNGSLSQTVRYGDTYTEKGGSAFWQSRLLPFIHGDIPVETEGEIDTDHLGTYTIQYTASHETIVGKTISESASREITVIDDEPPLITLQASSDRYTLPGHPYEEEGFSARDNYDGDLTAQVKRKEQDGKVTYTVSDSSGNEATAVREIYYDDRDAPVIYLDGDETITEGDEWSDSYYAEDNAEGDVTDKVVVTGSVDPDTEGTYELVYTVEDNYGNKAQASRIITVNPKPSYRPQGGSQDYAEPVYGDGIVFLTFDDGPGPYTERLLDILAAYDVPATFFVTNQFPGYQYLIAREAAEGHTVAVHTYSHVYSDVYSSTNAYWADFDRMNDIIEAQTGYRSDIFRFPGGSSNMVSANYVSGIMTVLTEQAEEMGLDYYDWNVASGDAGQTTDSSVVAANVISGMQSTSVSVVLMHDIHSYTVDAIETIIQYGLENGYTFMALEKGITRCHHGVNN